MCASGVLKRVLVVLSAAFVGGLVSVSGALAAGVETPVSEPVTVFTGTTASLGGVLNPGAGAGAVKYRFAYSPGTECAASGMSAPNPAGEVTGNKQEVSEAVDGLEAKTEYAVCLVAIGPGDEEETAQGNTVTFTTGVARPVVAGESVSRVTPFTAGLVAEVNPENEQTTECLFEYGKTSSYGQSGVCEQGEIEGGPQTVSLTASGLEPATTYHYRVVVANATGEAQGADGVFTTEAKQAPEVESESAYGLTSSDAKLEATLNPNYLQTSYAFQYATNEALTQDVKSIGAGELAGGLGGGQSTGPVDIGGGLEPGRTYYYRVLATNEIGTTDGPVQSFVTQDAPAVVTGEASTITRTTAAVGGTVDAYGLDTHYYVQYATGEQILSAPLGLGLDVGAQAAPVTLGAPGAPLVPLNELQAATTYRYRLVADNEDGTGYGEWQTLTTAAKLTPAAVTGEATGVTLQAATIGGEVNTQGLPSTYGFEFGTTPALGSAEPPMTDATSGTAIVLSASFSATLAPGTTYYYRVFASSQDGTSYGALRSFATAAFPEAPNSPTTPLLSTPANPEPHPVMKTVTRQKRLTRAQKLAKALKACQAKPKGAKRHTCERQAHAKYGPVKKNKKQ